jgi:hypothetical protein
MHVYMYMCIHTYEISDVLVDLLDMASKLLAWGSGMYVCIYLYVYVCIDTYGISDVLVELLDMASKYVSVGGRYVRMYV